MSATPIRTAYSRSEGASGWSPPDMSILSGGRSTPPIMPGDMFGPLWGLVQDLAEGAGAPVDYVAISVLGVAASLIGSKRRVQPFASAPQWREACVLWVALVGDPSSNKSPAIDAATAPLRGMELAFAGDHKARMAGFAATLERSKAERARWADLVKAATKEGLGTPALPAAAEEPEEPARRRLVVQDATPEALGEILAGNPNGTMHLRDELAGWLLSFERYSPGGREFWLEAYGGRPHVIDRKNLKKPLFIPFNGVSVVGGIQPEKLADCLLGVADDGLVPRFLWAWPDAVPYHRPRSIADASKLERVYERLASLTGGEDPDNAVVLLLDDNAGNVFEQWIIETSAGATEAASMFKSFCGKLRGIALRLALITEMMNWAADEGAR